MRHAWCALLILSAVSATTAASAQDHGGHAPLPAAVKPEPLKTTPSPADPMAGMDHAMMNRDAEISASPGPDMETPPPQEAGNAPPRAADAIWGRDAMKSSRDELKQMHGDFPVFWFQADRNELQVANGTQHYVWDFQGYYGGPTRRFWFKSEGSAEIGEAADDFEVQALYSLAISPFFDIQAGLRQDFSGPNSTYAVLGIHGLAPYLVEVDATAFVSNHGNFTARFEIEYDQRITQRLIFQPRAEVNLAAQDVRSLGIGAGVDTLEIGGRLRYEFSREFAPYVGIEQSWRIGSGVDFARSRGEKVSAGYVVAGVRFWF